MRYGSNTTPLQRWLEGKLVMKLKDKVAIITGAASGIGRATAYRLAGDGAHVVIGDINFDGADKITKEIVESGGMAMALKTDISSEDEVDRMVRRTIDEFGCINILVNNAAFRSETHALFQEMPMSEWESQIGITFMGTLLCCRAVIPHMISQQNGRIVNVTSNAAKAGLQFKSIYSACKAAVAGFSRSIALELATQGITVNCVSPGAINTPHLAMIRAAFPERAKEHSVMIPMGRIGEPEDVANMIAFLTSDDASYITGQEYSVDGGHRM